MDHVVHINNGNDAARPIILRLLPGEETIFELRVVNHGPPSDISLEASDPVFKAVRFRKPDNYVVTEEIIPIMARMPANKKRLDGEILLTSNGGESRVPISLLREAEDPGIDLAYPGQQNGKNSSDDLARDVSDPEDADPSGEEDQRVDADGVGDGDSDADADAYDGTDDKPVHRMKRYGDDAEDDEDAEDGDDFDAVERVRDPDAEEDGKEPRRIVFSRDRDLERYRSASRRKVEDNPDEVGGGVRGQGRTKRSLDRGMGRGTRGPIDGSTDEDIGDNTGNRPGLQQDGRAERRFNSRIDDRFVDRTSGQDDALGSNPWEGRPLGGAEEQRSPHDLPGDYQGFRPESDRSGGGGRDVRDIGEIFSRAEPDQCAVVEGERYLDQDGQDFEQDNFGPFGLVQIIPIAIFLALLLVLVLTFITYTIPEFLGAVGSSILIVTLIIYGAATLLKA